MIRLLQRLLFRHEEGEGRTPEQERLEREQRELEEEIRMIRMRKERDVWRGQ